MRRSLSPAQTVTHVPSAERSRPPLSSYSAYPHSFPDGSYYAGEVDREGLTPPASPQLTRAAHGPPYAESARSHSNQHSSSSVFAQRNRSVSLGSLAFTPLDASLVPPSQVPNAYDPDLYVNSSASHPYAEYSSLGHFYNNTLGRDGNNGYFTGPGASFPSVAASLQNHLSDVSTGQAGGAGRSGGMHVKGGGGRERAASMAALPSGGRWASAGDEVQRQVGPSPLTNVEPLLTLPLQNGFHSRSISLGGPFPHRPQPYRHSESPNYRTLLDSDADIDEEVRVFLFARLTAHTN